MICRKAAIEDSCKCFGMAKDPAGAGGFNSMLCPSCVSPMVHVRTIWRAFQDNLEVFECVRCNISISRAEKAQPEQ